MTTMQEVQLLRVVVKDGSTAAAAVGEAIDKDTKLRALRITPRDQTVCVVVEDPEVPVACRLMIELRPLLQSELSGLRVLRASGGMPQGSTAEIVRLPPRLRVVSGGKTQPPPTPWDAQDEPAQRPNAPERQPHTALRVLDGGGMPVSAQDAPQPTFRQHLRLLAYRTQCVLRVGFGRKPKHSEVCLCDCHDQKTPFVTKRLLARKELSTGDLVLQLECDTFPWCQECAAFEALCIYVNSVPFEGWKPLNDGGNITFELRLPTLQYRQRLRMNEALQHLALNELPGQSATTVDISLDWHTVNTRLDDFRLQLRPALPLWLQDLAVQSQGGS